jgi:hypothetical protein
MSKIEKSNTNKVVDEAKLEDKLTWDKPTISVLKINKLTEGFGPRFKDFPLPGLGAAS